MKQYTTHIKSNYSLLDVNLRELWAYRDLIFLFVKRNYSTRYKQTILGPGWLIISPLVTVGLYSIVFGNIAELPTDGTPPFVFYLCSNAIWSYFAKCLTETSNTFLANAGIMGKVYFPRLVMPISSVITGFLDLLIQLVMLAITIIIFAATGTTMNISSMILISPLIILQVALLGLGCGIIIAACTTKYRDLAVLVSFGVQLWMYASPVVYSTTTIPSELRNIYMMNPMAPIISCWRRVIIGTGEFPVGFWGISWIITFIILFIGVVLFSKIEKTFMDTV